jgi:hypothetical protein
MNMDTTVTQSQITDLYKTILAQEDAHTTIFITVLLGIVVIVFTVALWWNQKGAKRYIQDKVKEEVGKEVSIIAKKMQSQADEKIEQKLKEYETTISTLKKQIANIEGKDYLGMIDTKLNPAIQEYNTKISNLNSSILSKIQALEQNGYTENDRFEMEILRFVLKQRGMILYTARGIGFGDGRKESSMSDFYTEEEKLLQKKYGESEMSKIKAILKKVRPDNV